MPGRRIERRFGIGPGDLSFERPAGSSRTFWIRGGDTEVPIDA